MQACVRRVFVAPGGASDRRRLWVERLEFLRTYAREDPTVTYDLHAAFSKDPDNVNTEDALDEYAKIHRAAIRAGKKPPRKKRRKYDAVGNLLGKRFTNPDVPMRIRERLIAEGTQREAQFYVGRYGLNTELVKQIRSAFRHHEMLRLEVGSPWTDNTAKFAERLELRTGAIVLDRAGSRFLLYRGFTHADLARKGMLDPSCFNVGNDYERRQQLKIQGEDFERGRALRLQPRGLPCDAQIRAKSPAVRPSAEVQLPKFCDAVQTVCHFPPDCRGVEREELEYDVTSERGKVIEVDDDKSERIVLEDDEAENERMQELIQRIRYNAARVQGTLRYNRPTIPSLEKCEPQE